MPIQLGEYKLYDLEELSKMLEVNIRTLRRWIREGKLKAKKVGLRYYVTEHSLKEFFLPEEELEE